MERAGFRCVAALDFNHEAVATFRANFPEVEHVLEKDLTQFRPNELAELIGIDHVDVITGGPPCQGFSGARKVDGANHGDRLKDDPRRLLFREYLRYVEYFRPRVFVMENVLGIQSAAGGEYFTRVQHEARLLNYRVAAQVADAFSLGVPQKRRRQLIVGVRADIAGFFPTEITPAPRAFPKTTLGAAIGDLPTLAAGKGEEEAEYDMEKRRTHLKKWGRAARRYLYGVLEVSASKDLTAHRARPHSERDLRDFALLNEGESSAVAMRRGVEFEWPYSKEHFKDRYTRQSRRKPCSTIVAHLSKDGLMFIHPTQMRSLTPREAARVQSFPDWFWFPLARTHQFRLIGNAVPPLVAEAVGLEVRTFLNQAIQQKTSHQGDKRGIFAFSQTIPTSRDVATSRLQELARLDRRQLRLCEKSAFVRGWHALLFAFPELHPDNVCDHGVTRFEAAPKLLGVTDWGERYQRSGWPVALALIGEEAWRRHEVGEISKSEFYCVAAQHAGLRMQLAAASEA
jgi:DNA (cytosine-5)-methyltransferase 1